MNNRHIHTGLQAALECVELLEALGARVHYVSLPSGHRPLIMLSEPGSVPAELDRRRQAYPSTEGHALPELLGCVVTWEDWRGERLQHDAAEAALATDEESHRCA